MVSCTARWCTSSHDCMILFEYIRSVNEKLGEMFYFFELACGVSAYMLGVNPFNQPGVEFYKRNMFQLLGKPGYEV